MRLSNALQIITAMLYEQGDDKEYDFSIVESKGNVVATEAIIHSTFSQVDVENRLNICKKCSEFIEIKISADKPKIMQCKKCQCIINIKSSVQSAKCVLGKW